MVSNHDRQKQTKLRNMSRFKDFLNFYYFIQAARTQLSVSLFLHNRVEEKRQMSGSDAGQTSKKNLKAGQTPQKNFPLFALPLPKGFTLKTNISPRSTPMVSNLPSQMSGPNRGLSGGRSGTLGLAVVRGTGGGLLGEPLSVPGEKDGSIES